VRIIATAEEARASVLRRARLGAYSLPEAVRQRTRAAFGEDLSPEETVDRIFADVAARGDAAVREYMERLDGVRLESFEVPHERWSEALEGLTPDLREALSLAAQRIRDFHETQLPAQVSAAAIGTQHAAPDRGAWLRWTPVARAGLHIPGGVASYPSSLLMAAIPAVVAGVEEVIVVTPPGRLLPPVLAAAALAGVHRLFQVSGIQAIAALAFGTESIPKADVIAGPGNLFVQLAKQRAFGLAGIDGSTVPPRW
jgi:histidinol dehydrogenase